MGLDVGDRRIGIALSDPSEVLATPVKTLIRANDAGTLQEIQALVKKHEVHRIVIGLPYSLSGAIGRQAQKVLAFADQVRGVTSVEVVMQDERLSSVSADQKLREAGKKGSGLKSAMDAAAATVILQAYLDETAEASNTSP